MSEWTSLINRRGAIKWASLWPWSRCPVSYKTKGAGVYYGRCERVKNHLGPHALKRGNEALFFYPEGDNDA